MICNPTFRRNLLSLKRLQSDLTVAHILKSRGERSKSFRRRLGGLWKTFHIPWGSVHGLAEVVFHPTRCFFPYKMSWSPLELLSFSPPSFTVLMP